MAVLNKYHHGGKVPAGAVDIMRGTLWGNPFAIGVHGDRAQVVEAYRKYLWGYIRIKPEFAAQVRELHGKDLCCCCAPLACHGDVLERAAAWLHQQNPA